MIDLNDFSYKQGFSNGSIQIKSLSDEGFQKYLSKDSYSRFYLTNKYPFLKDRIREKSEDNLLEITNNKTL